MIKLFEEVLKVTNLNLISFLAYCISFYLIGRLTGSNKIRKVKNFVLKHSFSLIVIAIGLAIFIIKDFNFQQGLFTFAGVYLGFWLSEEQKKKEDNKKIKYYLGMIWQELRFNTHQLNLIKMNFSFYLDDPMFLLANQKRLININNLSKQLKNNVYQSFFNSGSVTSLNTESLFSTLEESDELFNRIEIAYNDMEYLKSYLLTVLLDFENKIFIWDKISGSRFQPMVIIDLKKKISDLARELAIARRTVLNARNFADKHLNKIGVKSDTSQLRNLILTDKDKDFIGKSIRNQPISIDEISNTFPQV